MGICATDLQHWIIRPTLEFLGDYSPLAEQLLLGTAAQESHLGLHCFAQHTQGMGLYRITQNTHRAIWDEYLIQYPELASRQRGLASQQQFLSDPERELITNLAYSTGIAWMIYRRAGINTQGNGELNLLAHLWSEHFDNGTGVVRTSDAFVQTYLSMVIPDLQRQVA